MLISRHERILRFLSIYSRPVSSVASGEDKNMNMVIQVFNNIGLVSFIRTLTHKVATRVVWHVKILNSIHCFCWHWNYRIIIKLNCDWIKIRHSSSSGKIISMAVVRNTSQTFSFIWSTNELSNPILQVNIEIWKKKVEINLLWRINYEFGPVRIDASSVMEKTQMA